MATKRQNRIIREGIVSAKRGLAYYNLHGLTLWSIQIDNDLKREAFTRYLRKRRGQSYLIVKANAVGLTTIKSLSEEYTNEAPTR